ncbi:MAG: gliding motility-associated C-terminal domain-containing protein [Cytophagales bacterium]|nr:gliding motility-associated C-terminal domain-containing protein [Bernardetiaceae bacterium]MDW8210160.1 gliding motility-associated C-terminal domain-containing protein [Cytophagales bacterium]
MTTQLPFAKAITALPFLLLTASLQATHIVGGEFQMTHVGGNSYRITLNVYFDAINGNPAAIDRPSVRVGAFSKTTHRLIQLFELPLIEERPVNYTVPACAVGQIVTRRITYVGTFVFNPNSYNEPGGYYLSWERCCRNNVIDNIIAPGAAGQTFYLEFPPLLRNNARFINSSPHLISPVSDYACVGQPFQFNYGATTDPDGDQLVYELRTPINGTSTQANPAPNPPNPGPYPLVRFVPGITVNNMIPGSPPLRISSSGMLTVTPTLPGLYVFAIAIMEFRGGQKIGETVREFQIYVLNCPRSRPPSIEVENPARAGSWLTPGDTIRFRADDPNRCATLVLSDPDPGTVLRISAVPINFSNVEGFSFPGSVSLIAGGTTRQQLCVPECPQRFDANGNALPYTFDLIATDNNCPVPQSDTVRVNVLIQVPPNTPPQLIANLARYDSIRRQYTVELEVGQSLSFNLTATDRENNTLRQVMEGIGFNPASLGMSLSGAMSGTPPLRNTFQWTPRCDLLQPNEPQREFVLRFTTTDQPRCQPPRSVQTTVRIILKNKQTPNRKPFAEVGSLKFDPATNVFYDTVFVGSVFSFPVRGLDPDGDSIRLSVRGIGFEIADLQAEFPTLTGRPPLNAAFRWRPSCQLIENLPPNQARAFDFEFRAQDFQLCPPASTDSVTRVRLFVKTRPNLPPVVRPELSFDARNRIYLDSVRVGEVFQFRVQGLDRESDSVVLRLTNPQAGMFFPQVHGRAPVTGLFRWQTTCAILADSTRAQDFFINFVIHDIDFCGRPKYDTARVRLRILPNTTFNHRPVTSAEMPLRARRFYVDTVEIGKTYLTHIIADDADKDSLLLRAFPRGFAMEQVGMRFEQRRGRPLLRSPLVWTPDCNLLPDLARGVFSRSFDIDFVTQDFRNCQPSALDTIRVQLVVLYRHQDNRLPVIVAQGLEQRSAKEYTGTIRAGELLRFTVRATDADGDTLTLTGVPIGFTLSETGLSIVPNPARGVAQVQSTVSWQPACQLLPNNQPRDFQLLFIATDKRPCNVNRADTLRVTLRLLPVPNPNPPVISTSLTPLPQTRRYLLNILPDKPVSFIVKGEDPDGDVITISAQPQGFALKDFDMNFPGGTGVAPIQVPFEWLPNCQMLNQRREFDLYFIVQDQSICGLSRTDTILVQMRYTAELDLRNFQPPNVFTPNGDGINDTFRIPDLPDTDCRNQFLRIEIYNRWGKLVFQSNRKDFEWDGAGYPSGVYYYIIFFTSTQLKGTVTKIDQL